MLSLISLFVLAGCGDDPKDTGGSESSTAEDTASTNTGDDGGTSETTLPDPAPLAELSDGDCPDMTSSGSRMSFSSSGVTREVITLLPDTLTEDMPVVFVWHPLGGDANYMVNAFGLESWANEYGAVIIVPESEPSNLLEWDFWNDEEDDLIFYDDLRSCAADQLDVDLSRVSAFGFSAGGLWASRLTIERGDTLSTAVIASGGCELELPTGIAYVDCEAPAHDFPALTMWGGENDTYGIAGVYVYFSESMANYRELLVENDHYVVSCDHGAGHTIPGAMASPIAEWLMSHTYGAASPYAASGIGDFPDYCWVEE